jgi:oligopeptide transport system ATP-binding protein
MTPLLDIENLCVSFSLQKQILPILRGINLKLFAGQTLGIAGESGCGKSILAKTILRLLPRTAAGLIRGNISFQGQNLLSLTEREMNEMRGKEISMIFQDPLSSLNPTQKIGKQIAEGYRRHHPHISQKEALKRATQLLDLVGIPQAALRINSYPHMLSGGMCQRVMIAIALASNPKILIADEPTTALDMTIQAQILHLLKEIQTKLQMSVIFISHDLSLLSEFCDHILIMYAGEIIESAPTKELFANPKHPYTNLLLKAIPYLDMPKDEPLTPIEGQPVNLARLPPGCSFCPRCPNAMKICEQKKPPFIVENEHAAACWLHQQSAVEV